MITKMKADVEGERKNYNENYYIGGFKIKNVKK